MTLMTMRRSPFGGQDASSGLKRPREDGMQVGFGLARAEKRPFFAQEDDSTALQRVPALKRQFDLVHGNANADFVSRDGAQEKKARLVGQVFNQDEIQDPGQNEMFSMETEMQMRGTKRNREVDGFGSSLELNKKPKSSFHHLQMVPYRPRFGPNPKEEDEAKKKSLAMSPFVSFPKLSDSKLNPKLHPENFQMVLFQPEKHQMVPRRQPTAFVEEEEASDNGGMEVELD